MYFQKPENRFLKIEFPIFSQGCFVGSENSVLVLDVVTLCCECSLGSGSYTTAYRCAEDLWST